MDAIRAFVAIELTAQIQEKLGQIINQLQEHSPRAVRWVPPKNIHLTLKFLGNVSPTNLNNLTQAIKSEALRHRGMEFCVGGFGAFPNRMRPRVIWVGVTAPHEMIELQRSIDRETERLGYPSEERDFSPHLTLGRVSQHASPLDVHKVSDALAGISVGELGYVSVKEIVLFRSDLQAGGAVYSQLITAPMGH